jgi:hypothetical protein
MSIGGPVRYDILAKMHGVHGDKACELCKRTHWTDRQSGELHALEVCFSYARQIWCCKRCHFDGPPAKANV